MQVKKYETKSVQEALNLIKKDLGPDAIILSIRENKKGFGLLGEPSVEVLAAVSEKSFLQKTFVQNRLRGEKRNSFSEAPARVQKKVIERARNKYFSQNQPSQVEKIKEIPVTSLDESMRLSKVRRYIDIEDEQPVQSTLTESLQTNSKVRQVLNRAMEEPKTAFNIPKKHEEKRSVGEIELLRKELSRLRTEIAGMRNRETKENSLAGIHPGAEYGLPYKLSSTFEKLIDKGLHEYAVAKVLKKVHRSLAPEKLSKPALVEAWAARVMLDDVNVVENPFSSKFNFFVGPRGSGKTLTSIKFAVRLRKKGHRILLVSSDNQKVGAKDQFRIYSKILNIPCLFINEIEDWTKIESLSSDYDYIIVDFPGFQIRCTEDLNKIKSILPNYFSNCSTHLVLSAKDSPELIDTYIERYSSVGVRDLIFAGIDESVSHGSLYNAVVTSGLPLHSFGLGPQITEDYEIATKERVIDLIFKITSFSEFDNFKSKPSLEGER